MPLRIGPGAVSTSPDNYHLMMNWASYQAAGYPKVTDDWQLLDVVAQCLEAYPIFQASGGPDSPMKGICLYSGGDTQYFACMLSWYGWHGLDQSSQQYLVETDLWNEEYRYILDDDSEYYQGCKWMNQLYQRDLLDPESIYLDRATQKIIVDAGAAIMPAVSLPGSSPTYEPIIYEGQRIYYHNYSEYGHIGLSATTVGEQENLAATICLLDVLSDPHFDMMQRYGYDSKDEFWYSENGKGYITERAQQAWSNKEDFYFSNGEKMELLNTGKAFDTEWACGLGTLCGLVDEDGTALSIMPENWPVMRRLTNYDNDIDWQRVFGYENEIEAYEDKGIIKYKTDLTNVSVFGSWCPEDLDLTVRTITDAVVDATWKMVYAESDDEFQAIWKQLQTDVEALGGKKVYEWRIDDLKKAKELRDSLEG